MRSGRTPSANVDAAVKLIGEAKTAGADYVQTPEMTNILERQARAAVRRRSRRRKTTPASPPFASWRASSAIWLHIGSLAIKVSPDKAANRVVPDRSERATSSPATTRSTCSTSTSPTAKAIASRSSYQRRRTRRRRRPAVGPARPDDLLRSALPLALSRAGRSRRVVPGHSLGIHAADRRSALARADARPRHRERRVRVRRRARRQA